MGLVGVCLPAEEEGKACLAPTFSAAGMGWVRVSEDKVGFVCGEGGGERFVVWGINYDHDDPGRLLEDYWVSEWPRVEEDFAEIKALGANVVRIHLQVGRFMKAAGEPNAEALAQLRRLVQLAERAGLYLDITGLGCYHKQDVPAWYDAMDEAGRWGVQAAFWEAVTGVCAASPAVFCYDLMNEPILPGAEKETDWLAGEFGGKYFVQRITLDLAGRSREEVAAAWVTRMIAAIRKVDGRHLITVGVIPWVFAFGGGRPFFNSEEVGGKLDFVSVHFYPKAGQVEKALTALKVYDVGKPLVVEEMFPLECSTEELDAFVQGARGFADGWIGFYWGRTAEEYTADGDLRGAIVAGWLKYFQSGAERMRRP